MVAIQLHTIILRMHDMALFTSYHKLGRELYRYVEFLRRCGVERGVIITPES